MNVYGSWWDKTITLYNKVTLQGGKIQWYRHVIKECFYSQSVEKVFTGDTTITSDVSICRIKVNPLFVPKREYDKLNNEEKMEKFTLTAGDIIVPEEIDFEINEYTPGQRSTDLITAYRDYPGCFMIDGVNVNTGGGRGNEHYRVKGSEIYRPKGA